MSFTTHAKSNRTSVPPSLKNWIFSLQSLRYLWDNLKRHFPSLSPRVFNQDPIENYFSCIRSHGVFNTNATCSSFISSTKTLLINNFVSPRSAGANCETDESGDVLASLRHFITGQVVIDVVPPVIARPVYPLVSERETVDNEFGEFNNANTAGYVLRRLNMKACKMV